MLASLEAKLAGLGIVLLFLGALALWSHHAGAVSQRQADQAEIGRKDAAIQAASDALTRAADTFRQISTDADAQIAAAHAQAEQSASVLQAAEQREQVQAHAAAAWRRKFRAAVTSPACSTTMEQTICPAVFETFSPPSR